VSLEVRSDNGTGKFLFEWDLVNDTITRVPNLDLTDPEQLNTLLPRREQ